MNPDDMEQIEDIDTELLHANNALATAERAVQLAEAGTYRTPEGREAAIAEAVAARMEVAQATRTTATALSERAIAARRELHDVDHVSDALLGAKSSVARFWQQESSDAPLADLRKAMKSALKTGNTSALAALATFVPRRLSQPAPKPIRNADGTITRAPDETQVRRELADLVGKARERLTVAPDADTVSRLDEMIADASKASSAARKHEPKRRYAFERDDDRISG